MLRKTFGLKSLKSRQIIYIRVVTYHQTQIARYKLCNITKNHSEYLTSILQDEVKAKRHVGRPKGSRDKKARIRRYRSKASLKEMTNRDSSSKDSSGSERICTVDNIGESSYSRTHFNQIPVESAELPTPERDSSWHDSIEFSADSDPFRLDWPFW